MFLSLIVKFLRPHFLLSCTREGEDIVYLEMTAFIIYLITMSGTPGPNTILSLQNASEKGLRKGIALNWGMAAGILLITTVSYILITVLGTLIPRLTTVLQTLSIIYILYLSWKMYRKNSLPDVSSSGTFREGFLLQLVNVKVMMLAVSGISSYVLPMGYSFLTGYLVSLLIPLVCFLTGLIWGIAGEALKRIYLSHRKGANIIFALSLIALALKNTAVLLQM